MFTSLEEKQATKCVQQQDLSITWKGGVRGLMHNILLLSIKCEANEVHIFCRGCVVQLIRYHRNNPFFNAQASGGLLLWCDILRSAAIALGKLHCQCVSRRYMAVHITFDSLVIVNVNTMQTIYGRIFSAIRCAWCDVSWMNWCRNVLHKEQNFLRPGLENGFETTTARQLYA